MPQCSTTHYPEVAKQATYAEAIEAVRNGDKVVDIKSPTGNDTTGCALGDMLWFDVTKPLTEARVWLNEESFLRTKPNHRVRLSITTGRTSYVTCKIKNVIFFIVKKEDCQ